MAWTKETIIYFLNLIRERPAIWDIQFPDYKIKQKRRDDIEEVAQLIGKSANEVNAKWTILRNQYSREKRRIIGRMRISSDPNSTYTSKWFAYKDMEFLMSNASHSSLSNIENDDSMISLQSSCSEKQLSPCGASTPPPDTATSPSPPPPQRPTYIPKPIKRENYAKTVDYKEMPDPLEVIINDPTEVQRSMDDDLTTYGLYVAAHIRKFPPHLQAKARLKINNTLYALDMEILQEYNVYNSTIK